MRVKPRGTLCRNDFLPIYGKQMDNDKGDRDRVHACNMDSPRVVGRSYYGLELVLNNLVTPCIIYRFHRRPGFIAAALYECL